MSAASGCGATGEENRADYLAVELHPTATWWLAAALVGMCGPELVVTDGLEAIVLGSRARSSAPRKPYETARDSGVRFR